MENFTLEKNITVFYVTASSFPEGIAEAHAQLHSILQKLSPRSIFGISYPNEKGVIVYKAAAEELVKGEATQLNLKTFLIKSGSYVCITVQNYRENFSAIDLAFKKLIKNPQIDPQGACIEWYLNDKDVKCMVRLQSNG